MEKIDIIQWSDDSKTYITQALSPAKNVTVTINEEEKIATVKVPKEELSLAIGKEGQNVRLASKLTGYRIEIEGKEDPAAATSAPAVKAEVSETEDSSAPEVVTAEEIVVSSDEVKTADDTVATAQEVVVTPTEE